MLIIELLMEKIHSEEYAKYKKHLDAAMQLPAEELYETLKSKVASMDLVVADQRNITMIALPTRGCPHHIRRNGFYGCSMCNYNGSAIQELAEMEALKIRSPEYYGMLIEKCLADTRDALKKNCPIELITGYDCLNSEEIPDVIFHECIEKREILKRKVRPFISIFETRITSVNEAKILGWKKNLGRKVVVEFGLEVSHDWLRNHWINKAVERQQVIEALEIIHKAECEASGNILIGIPGCTEEQSIELFIESALWLYNIGCDHILFSALCRKPNTLQDFIYQIGKTDDFMCETHLYNGEHTGIPYIFTVMEALCRLLEQHEEVKGKLVLSPANFPIYYAQLGQINILKDEWNVIQKGIDALKRFADAMDVEELRACYEEMKNSKIYEQYMELIEGQKKAGGLKNTIYHVAKACIEKSNLGAETQMLEKEIMLL